MQNLINPKTLSFPMRLAPIKLKNLYMTEWYVKSSSSIFKLALLFNEINQIIMNIRGDDIFKIPLARYKLNPSLKQMKNIYTMIRPHAIA